MPLNKLTTHFFLKLYGNQFRKSYIVITDGGNFLWLKIKTFVLSFDSFGVNIYSYGKIF